ncbi:MAG: ATP-binding cassette domain-containing protein [Alphaproteobacteria bacterium]|uniref:ATP-binding cassette domain-containing protein n=1 Tax=Candidatus Nitrobium versatile TaxID=2884831 RepID=A0A953JCL0_9BACT|nr:ATP-binding cassette domain-containing protein [Candidatus Nitrobium versatile]
MITVENLTKKFGAVTAVDSVSFTVKEGTIFGFLGPNGAGKTTTINILCTLLSATSGTAWIDNHDCMKEPSEVRKRIGIVFQDNTLDKELTAYENLLLHAYLYNIPGRKRKERIGEALRFVDLYERRNEQVKKFSGGMKRRLEVARSIVHQPRVLFLDEPTLGLDPQSRTHLWEFISTLPEKHRVTVFMTTHYMEEAEICDTIAIIDKGTIVAQGSPQELKRQVGGDSLFLTTTDNRRAAADLKALLGLDAEERDGELCITVSGGESYIPRVVQALTGRVLSVRLQKPTLNDVFLHLTGRTIRPETVSSGEEMRSIVRTYRRKFDNR